MARSNPISMFVAVLLCFLAGLAIAQVTRESTGGGAVSSSDGVEAASVAAREQAPTERFGASADLEPGSQRSLGDFRLPGGRSLRLSSAETKKGESCLVEEDSSIGRSVGCNAGGLFGARRAAFSVNTDGGPDRFDELYVVGVVAPEIRAVDVVTTDARVTPAELGSRQTFLFVSRRADLDAGVHPRALRLYGAGGRLVETIAFPPAG
jgi:hypothetical protein